jgi:hypothetical protein
MRTLGAFLAISSIGAAAALGGCGDGDNPSTTSPTTASSSSSTGVGGGGGSGGSGGSGGGSAGDTYSFDSRFTAGASAVSYDGQTFRQLLIEDMKAYIGGLTAALDSDQYNPASADELVSAFNYYYEFDDVTSSADPIGLTTTPPTLQSTYAAVSSGKNLDGKMAGNDAATDHKDWSTEFSGWSDATIASSGGSIASPEGLLSAFFWTLATQAYQRSLDNIPNEPGTSTPIAQAYVTPTGLDLRELIQKFLTVGVSYSQGTDDYLDDATANKGLLSANTQDGTEPFSVLGHAWDEGFGYFGAARDYAHYSDDELAGAGGRPEWQIFHDTSGDGSIDLLSEYNFGASTNAAKRDRGSSTGTDFTADAFGAFLAGRQLILDAGDTVEPAELDMLRGHAEAAIEAWENAIVATVVHYINDTIADTQAIGGVSYSFLDHAKHFSELKGFALGLQFNPKKKLSDAQFAQLHTLLGDAPVLATAPMAQQTQYVTDLLAARDLIQSAYGFAQADVENW